MTRGTPSRKDTPASAHGPKRYPGEIGAFLAAQALGMANFILNDPNPGWKIQAPEFIARIEKRLRWLRQNYG